MTGHIPVVLGRTSALNMLRGSAPPSLSVIALDGLLPVDPGGYTRGGRAVIYFYGGTASLTQPSAPGDIALHASYTNHKDDLIAAGAHVIGVSTEPALVQHHRKIELDISHELFSDPDLRVAKELGLPTANNDGKAAYQQLTLVARNGIIDRVFYPVDNPARSASQVVAWIRHQY